MKNYLLCILVFLAATAATAQDNALHIPKSSSYVVTIRPLQNGERNSAESISRLEMFGSNSGYGEDISVFGSNSLDENPRERLTNYLTGTLSNPAVSGIDSTRNIYAFHEEDDTSSYWAYIFPINNEQTFSAYIKTNLFTADAHIANDHGYHSVTRDRITAGWTSNYAIVLLADYYHPLVATNWFEELNTAQNIADSVAAAEVAYAQYSEQQTLLSDSVKKERTTELERENARLLEELNKGEFPEDTSLLYTQSVIEDSDLWNADNRHNDTLHDTQSFYILNRLMNLEENASIFSNKNFRSLQGEQFEAAYWYNYGLVMQEAYRKRMENNFSYAYMYGDQEKETLDTMLFPTMWEDSYIAGLVTFNDTVTTMEHRISVGEEMSQLTTGMYKGKVDRKMLRYVKSDNLMALVCLSVNMEKFMKFGGHVYKENLKYSGMGMFEQTYLAMWDILRVFIDDKTLYNILDGKFVFAVTDLKPVVSTYVSYEYDSDFNRQEVTKEKTDIVPEFIFMAGVGRKKDMENIIGILERTGILKKVNDNVYVPVNASNPNSQLYIVFQKGMLMFTNNEDLVNNHLKKGYSGNQRMTRKTRKMARRSPLMAWWDGRRTFNTMHKITKDEKGEPAEKSELEQSVTSGLILGKKGRKGVHRVEVTVTMPPEEDNKRNSLNRFFHLLNGLFLIMR